MFFNRDILSVCWEARICQIDSISRAQPCKTSERCCLGGSSGNPHFFKSPVVWLGPELRQTLKAGLESSIFGAGVRICVFGIPDVLNL